MCVGGSKEIGKGGKGKEVKKERGMGEGRRYADKDRQRESQFNYVL